MERLLALIDRIAGRVNISLRHMDFDVRPFLTHLAPLERFSRFCALCGLSPQHALHFRFRDSSLPGSYFLDHCQVESSVVYKSDVRGDELKRKGTTFRVEDLELRLTRDEEIRIKDSLLTKTLVHSNSHDPDNPEEFLIHKTVAMPWANIHGSPVTGSFLGAGSTIDLTMVQDSVIGEYAYIQVGEMTHRLILPGQIWISSPRSFDFKYRHDPQILDQYLAHRPGQGPTGIMADFALAHEPAFEVAFVSRGIDRSAALPPYSAFSPYALVKGECHLEENVFVSQRSFLEDSFIGQGSNVQENCFIIKSYLEGRDVTAHGAKIIGAHVGEKVFVGFNSFLRGGQQHSLDIGDSSIVMPHTIMDLTEPVTVPERSVVWGHIRHPADLAEHSVSIEDLADVRGELRRGAMIFHGQGEAFIGAFLKRIESILAANGAFYNGQTEPGHAQRSQQMAISIIQPFPAGPDQGMFPAVEFRP